MRQALNYALDRKRYAETIFKGAASADRFAVERKLAGVRRLARTTSIRTTSTRRGRCLQEAGVSGFETDILVIGIAQPQLLAFTEIYQASLAEIGVKLNIKNLEQAVWLDLVINKKPDYTGFWGSSDTFANVSPGSLFALSPGWRLTTTTPTSPMTRTRELVGSACRRKRTRRKQKAGVRGT